MDLSLNFLQNLKIVINDRISHLQHPSRIDFWDNSIESEEFLSEKICCYIINIRKKIIKKAKWLIVYGDFVLRFTNGVVPSKAIGLVPPPQTPAIMRSIHSNVGLSKKAIITQVIKENKQKPTKD